MADALRSYLDQSSTVPPLPDVAARVVQVMQNPECTIAEVRKIIETDAAIVTRLLGVANSALYGFAREIDTLAHAIALLGLGVVRNLVLALCTKELFRRFGIAEKTLFQHAALAGPVARRIARELDLKCDLEEVFIGGLLHDIGQIVLINTQADEYQQLFQRAYDTQVSLLDLEQSELGFDHAELGAAVVKLWDLPESLESIIRHHHSFDRAGDLDESLRKMTAVVAVASSTMNLAGVGSLRAMDFIAQDALPAWEELGLCGDDLGDLVALAKDEAEKAATLIE